MLAALLRRKSPVRLEPLRRYRPLLEGLEDRCLPTAIVGLTTSDSLVRFDAASPSAVSMIGPITGLAAFDMMRAIDFRPATGGLYGVATDFFHGTVHLYLISPTGSATQIGGDIALPRLTVAAELAIGIDFDPVADSLRVIGNNPINFRVNPDTGAVAGTDAPLNPGAPTAVSAAYTNNVAGAQQTTLYDIDLSTRPIQLVVQGGKPVPPGASPNGGTLTPVGSLGLTTSTPAIGFDIARGTGTAFASVEVGGTLGLYTIDLATGAATLVDPIGASLFDLAVAPGPVVPVFATGADAGGGPDVKVFDAATQQLKFGFFAYDANFTGGVRVAAGDVNGDGIPDIITAAGPGGGPDVAVYDGSTGHRLFNFFAFAPNFTGGCFVAAGDVNGDGFADIIVGADAGGGPNISVYSGRDNAHTRLTSFFAYDTNFTGGVRVAGADINGDGFADVLCGAGAGGGPNVTIFSGADNARTRLFSFFAFDPNFTNGIYVAGGDATGDGKADIFVGAGAGGGPNVAVFSGADASPLASFFAFDQSFIGGVRVGAAIQTSGRADLVAVEGPQTDPNRGPLSSPDVRLFDPLSPDLVTHFFAVDSRFTGGLYVAGNA